MPAGAGGSLGPWGPATKLVRSLFRILLRVKDGSYLEIS